MNATTPHVMFDFTTSLTDLKPHPRKLRNWRPRLRLCGRTAIAAASFAICTTASAGEWWQSWNATVSGDIIGELLPLGGSKTGTFTAPQKPAFDTVNDHGVVHAYTATRLYQFRITLSSGQEIVLNNEYSFGRLSAPQSHTHLFQPSNFASTYNGSAIDEVTAWGAHVYAPVPEPTTYALMAAGLAAIVWQRRKKQS